MTHQGIVDDLPKDQTIPYAWSVSTVNTPALAAAFPRRFSSGRFTQGDHKTMITKPFVEQAGLTQIELNLIEQFEADYNAVDGFLRRSLNVGRERPFAFVVSEYKRRHPSWGDSDLLRIIAEVRNAIVHGKTEPYRYVAVPTPAIAQNLKTARERLLKPVLAHPTFHRNVETVTLTHSLAGLLRIIAQRDYSQFPVYDAANFKGLITESGITRWLARHVSGVLSLVELEDVTVKQVLPSEETKANWSFVSRTTSVDEVKFLFAENKLLEAALVTQTGAKTEKLLGIATRWDVLR